MPLSCLHERRIFDIKSIAVLNTYYLNCDFHAGPEENNCGRILAKALMLQCLYNLIPPNG